MAILVASILDADHLRLGDEIRRAEAAGVDAFSFDVMDGHFVPRIELGPQFIAQLRQCTGLPLELHLMIEHPERNIERFCDVGADLVTFHFEATDSPLDITAYIQERGLLAGLALRVDTDLASVPQELLASVDHVLLLAVQAGQGGSPPSDKSIDRIGSMRQTLSQLGSDATIEVDGGVKPSTTDTFVSAGADLIVIGTGIFKAPDYASAVAEAKSGLMSAPHTQPVREMRFLAKPSLALIADPDRRHRLDQLRRSLDIPENVWDPITSPR